MKNQNYFDQEFKENLCDTCKRCKGFKDNNTSDYYDCKYNYDNKGVYYKALNDGRNYKCKYFKRNTKYNTFRFMSKNYKSENRHKITIVKYKQGKFNITTINRF